MDDEGSMTGGCLCGALRYRISGAPKRAVNCHCSMCRRHSGAAFLSYVAVERTAFEFQSGHPTPFRSSDGAIRSHCGACGSPLTFVFDADPGSVWVTVGSLDQPHDVPPTEDWFVADKIGWVLRDGTLKAWPASPPE
ncbi:MULTISPECIES: GFA family protein [Methylobacterium]|uniref:CENP-V/GFA domain-containing protein n=1 Tax=Methylobacterium jeotgali TaxID=381630 RepID=A0ABQ4T231_9HYPH|nr:MULTISPECIES: GFA family protein [Methylobacterium]PIU04108.1 MAG: GFA family protein [Methylobacterium sp. CG09_land_8_20_14_0_10_71_15]PIU11646.1 MAG: GFA family protein [Methylobacterium sp. CG08_land_8_20_14_0_20_71_15]GJE08228.1 hypothetical protein AOPFMNJM_3564 [Methylobacterium jeotgali]